MAEWVDLSASIMEGAGVLVTVVGAATAGILSIAAWRRAGRAAAYRTARQSLGRAILLGLELLVAADIIRTVSHIPTLSQVAVLAAIVAIRTFLSFTLEVELEGRWPWSRAAEPSRQLANGATRADERAGDVAVTEQTDGGSSRGARSPLRAGPAGSDPALLRTPGAGHGRTHDR